MSLVLLFAPSSSAINLRSLTSLDAGSGPGFIHVPVQQTAQQTIEAPMIRRRDSGHYSAAALGHLSSALTIYTINISISGQDTTVVLDTGSSELWVDPTCSMAAGDNVKDSAGVSANDQRHSPDYCESIGRYDPALSPTAKDLKDGDVIVYADNTTAEFNYYTDNIFIGGLQISGQQFGVANDTNGTVLGIMGMGPNVVYGYNSSSQPHSLVLDSMASQGLIASRAFSLNLREHDDAPGSIVFGGVDQKKFLGSLQTLPLESLQMTAGASGDGSSHETITVHGGTNVIMTPKGVSSQICDDAGGTQVPALGLSICSVSCDLKSQDGGLDVNFDGKTIRVDFENLVAELEQQGQTSCALAVTDTIVASDPPTYILGSPFLKAAYAVFDWDNQQVNLAQAADCGSQVVAIGTGPGAVPTGVGCEESAALPPALSSVGPVMAIAAMTSILALI
ncbi:hypothetical protein SLS64_000208 [Diaporthe eres]